MGIADAFHMKHCHLYCLELVEHCKNEASMSIGYFAVNIAVAYWRRHTDGKRLLSSLLQFPQFNEVLISIT